ncbi:hypothetical protein [uncultured Bacteroides sp.]|uniref:hypothetical protein n=1 Tax=uncultured Bacteroides sp. TaxID=162156 RepID=UPI00267496C0|nr:hypothetical protein [uncultured Bacteroides sp.]
MIERLNQIPLNDFIELSCGNYNCLLFNGEEATKEELKERATKLIVDYRNIVNPSGMKALVLDKEDLVKERARLLSLRICQTLISINCFDDVREVLKLFDVDTRNMSEEQLIFKIDNMLRSAIFEQKRNEERRKEEGEDERATPEQIRSSFDTEIAFLMTYFKMNIDSRIINAAVYANIVHQTEIDILIRKRQV